MHHFISCNHGLPLISFKTYQITDSLHLVQGRKNKVMCHTNVAVLDYLIDPMWSTKKGSLISLRVVLDFTIKDADI